MSESWLDLPPAPGSVDAPASPAARRLLAAVAEGGIAWWWPPRARLGDDGLLVPLRPWRGARAARRIGNGLRDARLAPWLAFLDALDRDCAALARAHAARVRPAALALDNGELHAPVLDLALHWCLAPRRPRLAARLRALRERHRRFLETFVRRLARDLRSGALVAHAGVDGPVTALWAHPEETHHGGQRVLRVSWANGVVLAYKPRPADAEIAMLGEDGVFAWINALAGGPGAVRLPTLNSFHGRGRDRDYLWQEWIAPPPSYGRLRGRRLHATRLGRAQAQRLWRDAGALAGACFGLGLVDLGPGNLVCGLRHGRPQLLPVDLEVCLFPVQRLEDTGLTVGERDRGRYPAGFERDAARGDSEGPDWAFFDRDDGGAQLRAVARPWRREQAPGLVADRAGRVGYGAYPLQFLRGLFELWMRLHLHRDELRAALRTRLRGHRTRVLLRPTPDYAAALDPHAATAPDLRGYIAGERAQLRCGDVPYFYTRLDSDAPLLMQSPSASGPALRVRGALPQPRERLNPQPARRRGEGFDLLDLAVAVRDAVAHVLADLSAAHGRCGELHDPRLGVRLHWLGAQDGEASFDWKRQDRRVVCRWQGDEVSLRVEALSQPCEAVEANQDGADQDDAGAVAQRLLRIDRIDAALRTPWTDGGFADAALEAQLQAHVQQSMAWLQAVVERHGWPGRARVGDAAAAAACRLLQHADGPRAFQDRCLRLIAAAARDGDMSLRELAYLTDALRVQRGRKQRYGTKFRRRDEGFEPCPIERPREVDRRRRAMGLEPLAEYAARIHGQFAAARE